MLTNEGLKMRRALAYLVFELDEVYGWVGRREMIILDDKVLEHLGSLQRVLIPFV